MSAVDDILADVPMDQLAAQLGVDQATAEQAARQAIPALLGGMQANSQDPAGAMSLAGALGDHPSDLIDGGVDLNHVDTNDGEKIVGNVFGPNQDQVAQTLGGNLGGQAGGLIKQLLPILAPIVMEADVRYGIICLKSASASGELPNSRIAAVAIALALSSSLSSFFAMVKNAFCIAGATVSAFGVVSATVRRLSLP